MVREGVVDVKNYISKSGIGGVDFAANPYVGCPHKCIYCYAEFMRRFTGHTEPWGDFVDAKRCSAPINLVKIAGRHVMLSSVTDPYNPYEKKYGITRGILEQLVHADCSVGILTKSFLVVRDIDLFRKMSRVRVGVSMNSTDEEFRAASEPYASGVPKRIEALKRLREAGVQTYLFMSPIFPGLSDVTRVIESVWDFADEFFFENLKLRGAYKPRVLDFIKRRYPEYSGLYRTVYGERDGGYWRETSSLIESYFEAREYRPYSVYFGL
jgi:DNA repair photolyase